jgi:ABC-type phosphate transport system substrate-binding protein
MARSMPSVDTVRSGEYQPLAQPLLVYVNRDRWDENPSLAAFVIDYFTSPEVDHDSKKRQPGVKPQLPLLL